MKPPLSMSKREGLKTTLKYSRTEKNFFNKNNILQKNINNQQNNIIT